MGGVCIAVSGANLASQCDRDLESDNRSLDLTGGDTGFKKRLEQLERWGVLGLDHAQQRLRSYVDLWCSRKWH